MASGTGDLAQNLPAGVAASDQRSLTTLKALIDSYDIPQKHAENITRVHLSQMSPALVLWTKRSHPETGHAEQHWTSPRIDEIIEIIFEGSKESEIVRWSPDHKPLMLNIRRHGGDVVSRIYIGVLARDLKGSTKCASCKEGQRVDLHVSIHAQRGAQMYMSCSQSHAHKVRSAQDEVVLNNNFQNSQAQAKLEWDQNQMQRAQKENADVLILLMRRTIHWERMTPEAQGHMLHFETSNAPITENMNLQSLRRYCNEYGLVVADSILGARLWEPVGITNFPLVSD
jgi:hypothetical protein